MHVGMLLQIAVEGLEDRLAIGRSGDGLTARMLGARVERAAHFLAEQPGERVVLVDVNSAAVPIALFASAVAGKPYMPINYRLSNEQLRALVRRAAPAIVIAGDGVAERLGALDGITIVDRRKLLELSADPSAPALELAAGDPDDVAVLLYTSGTTGEPKAAVLRHRNLVSYILGSVEFCGSDEDEAALVSVPPYHIAGVSAVLSSTYGGRRLVYAEAFEPQTWVELVRAECITHAMVVPTMLGRILEVIEADGIGLPSMRSISYGGGPMPVSMIERAMRVLPDVGFTNAYGLTETSSTIAVLGPQEHREALASSDLAVRARLASVGRPLPSVEISICDALGKPVAAGEHGEVWVRGEQVSGEYLNKQGGPAGDWYRTHDEGHLDADGFLFVHGRLDDVIVRGGENISPGEIETVLAEHAAVDSAAALGIPDNQWGERVVAAVTLKPGAHVDEDELRGYVKAKLRSVKTPDRIDIRGELPFSETGKLLRRVLREELATKYSAALAQFNSSTDA